MACYRQNGLALSVTYAAADGVTFCLVMASPSFGQQVLGVPHFKRMMTETWLEAEFISVRYLFPEQQQKLKLGQPKLALEQRLFGGKSPALKVWHIPQYWVCLVLVNVQLPV